MSKILLMITLYIILALIGFFNLGLYDYISGKYEWKSTDYDKALDDFDGNIQNPQTEAAKESEDSPLDTEISN